MKVNSQAKKQIPNVLTVVRIVLAFLLVFFIVIKYIPNITTTRGLAIFFGGYDIFLAWLMLVVFVVAISTDFVDGYLARKWKVVSDFGKLWDPLGDKIITVVAFVYLALPKYPDVSSSWFNPGLVVLIIIRDLIVDGSRVQMAKKGIDVKASQLGRIKTFFISLVVIYALLINALTIYSNVLAEEGLFEVVNRWIIFVLLILSVVISYTSGVEYLLKVQRTKK
ncbi:CDP-diacylglycerol--glycerol-3-phosphate 3-phosphatidyltransferase [Mycoplasmopsis columboralis]|uniref:CDP-diacylglycerol--glycerol-3-phosphate 3-phosphatidyltransferase n=1 Tax=Mycoplasmopsis columboralis TaxID=171282 RepID=A0A449B6E2_9BACT|nr:CDP-diacylglycerol--glycerol-3-phosphate 3-phosphatidyltransferase [Mycoplasmopsis columboralis]VEU76173.1 CDP-diacylglycerol--glycerol-3-phosphate 3-phosphatidyltransferase [Mycoplasmopsis columboralis]